MGIWLLIAFCVCLFLGVPVFVCIGVVMFLPVLFDPGFSASAEFMVRSAVNGVDSTTLLALPLFILAGNIMGAGGISKRLFDVFAVLTGKRSGGIPIAVILTSVVYAALCGSGPAATAAVGAMAIPVMRHLKYKDEFSCVVSSAGGGIGIINTTKHGIHYLFRTIRKLCWRFIYRRVCPGVIACCCVDYFYCFVL